MSGGDQAVADAIVVAAGRSERMGGRDKLAAEIAGRPLLAWTLDAIAAAPEVGRIVLAAPAERLAELATAPWLADKVVAVVAGGARRQESVAAGVERLDELDGFDAANPAGPEGGRVVLVHDGARPLVSPHLVGAVARAAARHGAAIPVLPVAETLKRILDGRVAETIDRAGVGAAQTPQGVRRDLLRRALRERPAAGPDTFTDEAALLEACRIEVHAIPGEPSNLKVTVPDDLRAVERALAGASPARFGTGHDSHPFGPAEPLALGGIEIPGAPRLHGHSDGDVALHAVADALLGAAGLGDLGRLFPADARTPRGVPSRHLLDEVARRVAEAGFRPISVDVTIVGARPRLAGRLDAMRDAIADLLGVPPAAVNVKASTGNLDGMAGAGRGIAAHAAVAVEPRR